jgi:phosphatidylethanolamine/phosphatidyl-N-methylethanolamine N-methyltransferase
MKMTNHWNRFIYRLWVLVYDAILASFFLPRRKRVKELLAVQPEEMLLLVGVGTGADIPLLPEGVDATGMDISLEMLAQAESRLPFQGCNVTLLPGDA